MRIPDEKLPPITFLVPLYREANVVASLVRSIEALDYPPPIVDHHEAVAEYKDRLMGRSAR